LLYLFQKVRKTFKNTGKMKREKQGKVISFILKLMKKLSNKKISAILADTLNFTRPLEKKSGYGERIFLQKEDGNKTPIFFPEGTREKSLTKSETDFIMAIRETAGANRPPLQLNGASVHDAPETQEAIADNAEALELFLASQKENKKLIEDLAAVAEKALQYRKILEEQKEKAEKAKSEKQEKTETLLKKYGLIS
jgi:hypothetical protein